MTYAELLQSGTEQLTKSQSTSPFLDAEVLLCFAAGINKEQLISNRKTSVLPKVQKKYLELVEERIKDMPVAYLTGTKEFFGHKFMVNKHVLIPRPETETLVERIAFELKGKHNLKILDIGTGSGCIIISLAKTLSNANHYSGSDDSPRALAVAEENAKLHRVKVNFMRSDLTRTTGTNYDVIVANLPYLPAITDESIKHEPKQALVAKEGGLELYKKLLKELSKSESKPIIYLEFGHDQADRIKELVKDYIPNSIVEIFKDLSGVPRFARIWQRTK